MKDPLRRTLGLSAGGMLILGAVLSIIGAWVFAGRRRLDPFMLGATTHELERGLFIAAVIVTVIGFSLLEDFVADGAGHSLVRVGALAYLIGGAMMVVREGFAVAQRVYIEPLSVIYVLLALVGQTAIGAGLIRSSGLPKAIGWLTVLYNLAMGLLYAVVTPDDIYTPIVHHVMPLVIGLVLLVRGIRPRYVERAPA